MVIDDAAEKEKSKAVITKHLENETTSVKYTIAKFSATIAALDSKSIPASQACYYKNALDMCSTKLEVRLFELTRPIT